MRPGCASYQPRAGNRVGIFRILAVLDKYGITPTLALAKASTGLPKSLPDRRVVFDNRNFGASDGEPRQEIDPWQRTAV